MSIEFLNFKFGDLPREEQLKLFEAWLDGKDIERYSNYPKGWRNCNPSWNMLEIFRVKPKPKPKTFGELTKEEQKELLYAHHYGEVEFLDGYGEWKIKSPYHSLRNTTVYRIKE